VELLKVAFDGLASPVAFFLMEACATGTGGEGRARCSLTTTSRWLRCRAVAGEGVRGGGGAPSTAASGRRAHIQWASHERVEGGSPRESGRRVEEHRKLRAGGDGEPRPLGKESEWKELGSEWDSEERILERLLDPIFILILLSLTSQLILQRLLEML